MGAARRRLRMCVVRSGLTVVCAIVAGSANAQSSLPLFLEAARDPGPADLPSSARTLGIGGLKTPSGGADDAMVSPAGLMLGRGREALFALGTYRTAREELTLTPRQMPPFESVRTASRFASRLLGSVAVTSRGARWAAAGFWDESEALAYAFATARNQLSVQAIPGVILTDDGTGDARFSRRTTRVGGAVAGGPSHRRVAVGGSFYAVRESLDVYAAVDTTHVAVFYAPYAPSRTETSSRDSNSVNASPWGVGGALSLMARPAPALVLAARWQHEPAHQLSRRAVLGGSPTRQIEEAVTFEGPDVIALSASWAGARTMVGTEMAWIAYGGVYGPRQAPGDPTSFCQTLSSSTCAGWGFGSYAPINGRAWRAGVEHGLGRGARRLILRAGLSVETGYSVARSKDDPALNALQAPAPVVTTPFVPPRDGVVTTSWGMGFRWARAEIASAMSFGSRRQRAIVDIRLAAR